MVNRMPQPTLLGFRLDKAPHLIRLGFCILPLAELYNALSGFEFSEHEFIDCFKLPLFFFNSSITVVGLM
jgi:hypothetical protein